MHTRQNTQRYKEKTTHRSQCTKVCQEKVNFIYKNILMYSLQKYRALSTSKKESQKQWNKQLAQSQKNQFLNLTQYKLVIKTDLGNKVFGRENSVNEFR